MDIQEIIDRIYDSFDAMLKEEEEMYASIRNRLEEILEEKSNR